MSVFLAPWLINIKIKPRHGPLLHPLFQFLELPRMDAFVNVSLPSSLASPPSHPNEVAGQRGSSYRVYGRVSDHHNVWRRAIPQLKRCLFLVTSHLQTPVWRNQTLGIRDGLIKLAFRLPTSNRLFNWAFRLPTSNRPFRLHKLKAEIHLSGKWNRSKPLIDARTPVLRMLCTYFDQDHLPPLFSLTSYSAAKQRALRGAGLAPGCASASPCHTA